MSEYRPGVTSPHTLSQRWPTPAPALFPTPIRRTPSPRSSSPSSAPSYALEHSYYLAAYLQRGAPLPVSHPLAPRVLTRFLSVAPGASFHVILLSHYPSPSCLRCSSGPPSSFLSSSSSIPEDRFLTLRFSRFPPAPPPPKYFRSVSAISFTPFCSD